MLSLPPALRIPQPPSQSTHRHTSAGYGSKHRCLKITVAASAGCAPCTGCNRVAAADTGSHTCSITSVCAKHVHALFSDTSVCGSKDHDTR